MYRVLVVAVDRETSQEAIELAQKEDFIYAAVGIHPNRARELTVSELQWFEQALCQKNVVGVGEIGLDYYHETVSREIQKKMFNQFLELAYDMHMPVCLHVRAEEGNARQPVFNDTFNLLEKHGGPKLLGIFHCFAGNSWNLTRALDYQMFISFAGNLTFPRALELRSVAKDVPMDRIMVETDCPYLTAQPNRGKQNRPDYIWPVYQQIAQLHDWHVDFIVDKVWENTEKLFGWSPDADST